MPKPNASSMSPYGRQVFICIRDDGDESKLGHRLLARFNELNRKHHLNERENPARILCTLADCPKDVGAEGPVLVVYPEGIWYHQVDEVALDRIFHEHILGGRPVEELIFHRLYPQGQEPAYAPAIRKDVGTAKDTVEQPDRSARAPAKPPAPESPEAEAIRAATRRARKKKGLVIVNTGTGKGKTTAALGVMTRAWGRGMRVGILQFIKHEQARFGEVQAGEKMGIDWMSSGDGWTWTSKDMDETEARARHGWEMAQKLITSGKYDLLVLDEFTYTLHYGWLDTNAVIEWLKVNKPPMLHLIITGRYAPEVLVEFADLVTEMREIKHPFEQKGIRAQPGIEY